MSQKNNPLKAAYWIFMLITLCLMESIVTPVEAIPYNTQLPFSNTTELKNNDNIQSSSVNKITIGNTQVFGENGAAYPRALVAYKVKLTEKATVQSLSIYVAKISGVMSLGIYSDFWNKPDKLKVSTADFNPVVGWNIIKTRSEVSLTAGYYWLCFETGSNAVRIKASGKGGTNVYYKTKKYEKMPVKFSRITGRGSWQYSFYAVLYVNSPKTTPTTTKKNSPTITRTKSPSPTVTAYPTRTPSPVEIPSSTLTPSPTRTPSSTRTPSPTRSPTPTVTITIIPTRSITPTPTSTPKIVLQEWTKYRQGKEMIGHGDGSALMLNAPALKWKYDIAGWKGYFTAKMSTGGMYSINIPYQTTVNSSFYENNKFKWGLGPPGYDLYGNGTTVFIPDSPSDKVADILPNRKGLEKVTVETYNEMGDNARARLYAYNSGVQQQVWESEPIPTCYGPVVTVVDANNDGQTDIIIATHYRLVVLNGATGATMMNLKYSNQRNYGFLGVANIDADPYPEFAVISDFAQHLEVIDNDGSNLVLKWFNQIESNIFDDLCITQPGPDAFLDVDHDGKIEVICNIFNYNHNNHWSVLVFNASDGVLKYELGYCYLNGLADINKDGFYEMFLTSVYGLEIPTYGKLMIYRIFPDRRVTQLWTYPNGRFNTLEANKLPLTANTMASEGKTSIVRGHVSSDLTEDFFISEPGPYEDGETCKCFGFNNDQVLNRLTFYGPSNSRLDVLGAAEINQPADGNDILLSVCARGNPNETISSLNSSLVLQQWGRKLPQTVAPPVIADLEGEEKMELIGLTSNDEVICLETPRFNNGGTLKECWRMKGQGMTKDADNQQDGVLVADLDSDGKKEVIFAKESFDGKASIVAVRPNGSVKWQHVFSGFDGSAPKWNLGGVTYWVAGNFTTKANLDLYVTVRRNKMHSDVGFLLNGLNGNVIWEANGVLLPGGNPNDDIRGHGGDRVACADMNKDGFDELVCAYPDRVYVVDGKTGVPNVIKSTADTLFPQKWVAYAAPALVNLTGDNTPEILYGRCGYLTALLDNNCNVLWQRDYNASGNNGCSYLQGIGDCDKDSKLEIGGIYKNTQGSYEFRFYKASSGESYIIYPLPVGGKPCTDVVTADLDRDGADEFLFGQGIWLRCMGKNGLKWSINLDAAPGDIAIADPDSDGNLEIIVTTTDGYIRVYE